MTIMLICAILVLSSLSGCTKNQQSSGETVEITVSAAASLQDALTDITTIFEKENPRIKVNYNFGGSGSLQQQISQGAPVDIFFSAADDKFKHLVNEGLIEDGQSTNLLQNELALIIPSRGQIAIAGFTDLIHADKVAIGTPESVPAGKYAKETLESLNRWDSMENKVIFAKDVRQVLTYVETNNVDAGIVYLTDALISDKVKIIATAETTMHTPIVYPVGIVKNRQSVTETEQFYSYLQSEQALQIFEKYGFKGLK
ncbi:molybdate ABC transporter substrate-binding protein [Gracilibacillus xinjiangensis]|uniref:Molybdate ABC transporter substrate-binding protein n=1 Tax=Gracilibacillus xinjiangensis TaxID=1193282 RepID=A0ABV8WUK8_9BACI